MTPHNLLPPARIVALGGPVSAALAAMRSDPHAVEVERLRSLRSSIAARIEADLALLDALDGDIESEDAGDAEPSLCGLSVSWPGPGGDDREDDPAEWGIADSDGLQEQTNRDRMVAL